MIKSILSIVFVIGFVNLGFADNEIRKDKAGDERKTCKIDSITGDTLIFEMDQCDDTLVFDDWEGSVCVNQDRSVKSIDRICDFAVQALSNQSNSDGVETPTNLESSLFEISIFPNPVASELHIEVSEIPSLIRIINMSGVELLNIDYKETIDLSFFEAGMYIIEIVYDKHIESKKFVKSL